MNNNFIRSAFIRKNTPELREKLEKLGYHPHPCWAKVYSSENSEASTGCLYTGRGFYAGCPIGYEEEVVATIDCEASEDLFLALAALRDDRDHMQWFTDGEDRWFKCGDEHMDPMSNINAFGVGYHKATMEELIKHFKEK